MTSRSGDWECPTCKFTIWGSKPKCLKCGSFKPVAVAKSIDYWTPGNMDQKWNQWGPYSRFKGGYYGPPIEGEPPDLKYPNCGCKHMEDCPKRHHETACKCYTCRNKSHKW